MNQRRSMHRGLLLILVLCVVPLLACGLVGIVGGTAAITNAVMAKDVKGDNFDPVGITDTFSFDQPKFHAVITLSNAPSNTMVKAVWTAVDVGTIAAPNTQIDQTEVNAAGSRNLDFSLTPNGPGWPSGSYKVDVYLNGKLDRTLTFTVAPMPKPTAAPPALLPTNVPVIQVPATLTPPTPVPPAQPAADGPCPPVAPSASTPSGILSNAVTSTDVDPGSKDPKNPTVVFAPNAIFHVVVTTQNAPANTKIAATWYATDLGAPNCNMLIDTADLATDGSRNIDFSISPRTSWPNGKYRVEILVNGIVDRVVSFTVSGGSPAPRSGPVVVPPTTVPNRTPSTQISRPSIPVGQGGLTIISRYGEEINFTIDDHLYKVPPNGNLNIFLPPGKYPYSANIPGIGSANDVIEVQLGVWFTQTFSD